VIPIHAVHRTGRPGCLPGPTAADFRMDRDHQQQTGLPRRRRRQGAGDGPARASGLSGQRGPGPTGDVAIPGDPNHQPRRAVALERARKLRMTGQQDLAAWRLQEAGGERLMAEPSRSDQRQAGRVAAVDEATRRWARDVGRTRGRRNTARGDHRELQKPAGRHQGAAPRT
jgi:hypothetical protein